MVEEIKNVNAYNEFLKGLTIEDIVLLQLEVKRPVDSVAHGEMQVTLQPDFYLIDQDENRIRAQADFDLNVTEPNGTSAFSIKVSFMAIYNFSQEYVLSGESEQQFVSRNVQSTSGRTLGS